MDGEGSAAWVQGRGVSGRATLLRKIVATAAAILAILLVSLVALAWFDVREHVGAGTPSVSLRLSAIRPSLRHGMWVEFELSGVPELSCAYWRLVPWRAVEVSM